MQTTHPSPLRGLRGLALALSLLAATAAGGEDDPGKDPGTRVAQAPDTEEVQEPAQPQRPAPPPSASDVEEIVVVGAESESSGDFSAGDSVTGFGAEDLAALGAQSIADLASFTPNLEIVTAGATTPTFFIRGVGLNDFNPNSTGSVSVYQDDVAINAPAIQLGTLFDVEAVNVLRGPQGTGLARNSSAGAIKIYSRKPTGEFGGFLRTDFGNYDLRDYEGAFEAPIWEDYLAGRFAFRLTERDGTLFNRCGSKPPFEQRVRAPTTPSAGTSFTQGPWSQCGEPVIPNNLATPDGISLVPPGLEDYVNDTDNWATRGTLLFQPTLDQSWLLNAHGAKRDELARLGQSYGTQGVYCYRENVVCSSPFNVPPENADRTFAGRSSGLLGGATSIGNTTRNNNTGYQPIEVRRRWGELAPCLASTNSGACNLPPITLQERLAAEAAKRKVANELARELDSEPWEGDFNQTGPTELDSWGGYLKGDIVLPRGIELNTTTAYDGYDRLVDIDLDMSPETLFHIRTDDEAWQAYQDLSLSGDLGETGALRWEVGGWFLREELDAEVDLDFGVLSALSIRRREYIQNTSSAGGFGYFAYDFWDDFTLDGGWRYNWEQKRFEMEIEGGDETSQPEGCIRAGTGGVLNCRLDETWNASTGTLRLSYRFREDTQVSWKYTRGWKPGSINATASNRTGPTVAEPEELDAFEMGLRGSWFQGLFGMDASLFYYQYDNYQIFTAQQFSGGPPEFVILNADSAEVYGSEIDATLRPWDGAFWNARFSWLEAEFVDFLRRDQFLTTTSEISFKEFQNSGNSLLNSPEFKVSLTAEQGFPIGRYGRLTFRYDGVWTATTYYDASEGKGLGDIDGRQFLPDDTIAQVPYWLHNARVSWRSPDSRLELAAWVRNIENKPYKTFAFDGSTFQSTTIYFVGDPRTFGISAVVTFF